MANDIWTESEPMSVNRVHGHSACTLGNKVYLFGGSSYLIETLDAQSDSRGISVSWKALQTMEPGEYMPKINAIMTPISQTEILIIGGSEFNVAMTRPQNIIIFNTESNEFS